MYMARKSAPYPADSFSTGETGGSGDDDFSEAATDMMEPDEFFLGLVLVTSSEYLAGRADFLFGREGLLSASSVSRLGLRTVNFSLFGRGPAFGDAEPGMATLIVECSGGESSPDAAC